MGLTELRLPHPAPPIRILPGIAHLGKDPNSKFQVVSTECVSLACMIMLKNHKFGTVCNLGQNKKSSENTNPGEASMPLWGRVGKEDVSE